MSRRGICSRRPHPCPRKASQAGGEILRVASRIASASHGPLHAVHAYFPLPEQHLSRRLSNEPQLGKLSAQTKAAAGLRFQQTLRRSRVLKSRHHLLPCHPMAAIEQIARDIHSAIVVMGAISRSAKIMRVYSAKLGIPSSPHVARATAASNALDNGSGYRESTGRLRRADVSTTRM